MLTKITLHWVCENPGHEPDEGGYYRSVEGRFEIAPKFRHTVYPDGYSLRDRLALADDDRPLDRVTFDTIRDAKERAVRILETEITLVRRLDQKTA